MYSQESFFEVRDVSDDRRASVIAQICLGKITKV